MSRARSPLFVVCALALHAIAPSAVVAQSPAVAGTFDSIWQTVCNKSGEPRSGDGLIVGSVRAEAMEKAGSAPVVQVTWPVYADDGSLVAGRAMRKRAVVDSAGRYALCGIPARQPLTFSATDNGASTVPVSFEIGKTRIAERDITLPTGAAIDRLLAAKQTVGLLKQPAGAKIVGVVRDSSQQPIRDARITVSGITGEIRSSATGEFAMGGIPAGPRVVAINAVGKTADRRVVDFTASDSAFLEVTMSRTVTNLTAVTVSEREKFDARLVDLAQRRKAGFGYWVDSLALDKMFTLHQAFNVPRVNVRTRGADFLIFMVSGVVSLPQRDGSGGGQTCAPSIWIDGDISDIAILNSLSKDQIGLIEIYPTGARAPMQFGGMKSLCGVVAVWRRRYISP